jgi:hypothetical protein
MGGAEVIFNDLRGEADVSLKAAVRVSSLAT